MIKEPQCSLPRLLPNVELVGPQFAPHSSLPHELFDKKIKIKTTIENKK
jgi:hypothetical protein